jgi:hypothetical protein
MRRCSILSTVLAITILGSAAAVHAQVAAKLPEFVVKDNLGNVLGPAHVSNNNILVWVRDTTNNDFFYLKFGKWWFRASDTDEMFFDNNDCTGDAYVYAPNTLDDTIPAARGSTYTVGPTAAGGTTLGRVYRSTATTGANNGATIESKWELSNSKMGEFEGPTCTMITTTLDTVLASPVSGLDAFVSTAIANKPFSVE